ncbi:LacI family DNA-binding transcriptional regulator [Pseudoprimorskyibacter insulae]|uniref:HTH-type transcriptional repressor CytR n=1 Tax=Pseudoprimorskyibacter insulae TaxID=1695997 RepID=A0A2R8AVZ5_9RHOB|nr:LacI family DNA-binding transcriptional regulator [Pseudoprimorskyibacter insulae]SPF80211.1 HTH-type transcriptional repressor CytR [Pseudoprimorskyibacter insulae]
MTEISSFPMLHGARRRVTISDVSDALGLTKSTVSRALNGYPDISEATRLKVQKMATKMGYRPHSQAQAIRTGRVRALGLVVQMHDHDSQRPFLAEFLSGISCSASAEGWTLTVATAASEAETLEAMRALVRDGKADGFILPRSRREDPRVDLLRQAGVPFVLYGRAVAPEGCAWFDFLGEQAMSEAVLHLASLGHRRIGFFNGGLGYVYSGLRAAGFGAGMSAAGLTIDPQHCRDDILTAEHGRRAALSVLDHPEHPTAIICATDMGAIGIYAAAEELGLRIGRDLSVIAYDGTPEGAFQSPPLSTFAVDNRRAGERLGALLIRRIRGEAVEALRETDTARFLDRGSAGRSVKE